MTDKLSASERMHRSALDTDPEMFIALSSDATHELADEVATLEQRAEWMKRVLTSMDSITWMRWVEGPYYATGDMNELEFFRALAEE
ncbi:hypothetical protein LCGC14_0491170 [marine sediment metagenome]|uniref:Uncharacterized protein n=1 Tax=marine sediment metagenome TaxID=412755 RepID=A0A0F9SBS8_9ZZZZ